MRNVFVTEFVTLDGVMEDPGGSEGFEYGGWSFQFWGEESAKYKLDKLFASDAILLGRVTYQGFAKAWPTMKDENGFADRMNSLPKYVVSSRLRSADWHHSTIIKGDIPAEVGKLKAMPGRELQVHGSGVLLRWLLDRDLVDELNLRIYPVIVGDGLRLFPEKGQTHNLELVESRSIPSGVMLQTYRPAGRATFGTAG